MNQSASVRARTAHRRSPERIVASPPRRVSGPVRRPLAAGAAAGGRGVAVPAGRVRRGTSTFDRIRALPDHRLVDGLLRSQAWIWLIGIALGGIVAMQVSLLKLNAGIGQAVETATTLERQNTALELRVARLSSGERLEKLAADAGMVMPAAGSVEYVEVRPGTDARWAQTRMRPPSDEARAVMANDGIVPTPIIPAPATALTSATAGAPAQSAAPAQAVTPAAPVAAPEAVAPSQSPVAAAPSVANTAQTPGG